MKKYSTNLFWRLFRKYAQQDTDFCNEIINGVVLEILTDK